MRKVTFKGFVEEGKTYECKGVSGGFFRVVRVVPVDHKRKRCALTIQCLDASGNPSGRIYSCGKKAFEAKVRWEWIP